MTAGAAASLEISRATIGRLLVRPTQRSGESSEGHFFRVASLNGLGDPMWLLEAGRRRPLSIARICPLCLDLPGSHWLEDWKDRAKPFCREHGRWLVDKCSRCSRLLRWSNVRFKTCGCGQDLRELAHISLSAQMRRALDREIASLPALIWLGSLDRYGLTMKPLKKASRVSMANIVELAEAGARIVDGWPEAFFAVLDSCRQDLGAPTGLRSINDALPGITGCLAKLRDGRWRERVAQSLGSYVAASHQSSHPIIGRNAFVSPHPTVARIARELGIGPKSLLTALERLPAASVAVRSTAHGRSRRLVSAVAVQQVRLLIEDQLSIKAAVRLLGVSSRRIGQLVDQELLEARGRRLSRAAVENLLLALLATGSRGVDTAGAISLSAALRYYVPSTSTARFFRAILDGSLIVSVPAGSTNLKQMLIGKTACRDWTIGLEHAGDHELTMPECAELLGLKQQVVYHLARVGLLPVHGIRSSGGRLKNVATAAAVDLFQRRYEALARLAAAAGVQRQAALGWAKSRGISLVSGPAIDGGRQYFALRPGI